MFDYFLISDINAGTIKPNVTANGRNIKNSNNCGKFVIIASNPDPEIAPIRFGNEISAVVRRIHRNIETIAIDTA